MLYFDTCALIPYYRPEALSDTVQGILTDAAEPVAISPLGEVEFASVLARLVRMGEMAETHASTIQAAFAEDIAQGRYRLIEQTTQHYRLARDWLLSRKTGLRTLDALHLATASLSQSRLVTADATLADAARKLGIPVQWLG